MLKIAMHIINFKDRLQRAISILKRECGGLTVTNEFGFGRAYARIPISDTLPNRCRDLSDYCHPG